MCVLNGNIKHIVVHQPGRSNSHEDYLRVYGDDGNVQNEDFKFQPQLILLILVPVLTAAKYIVFIQWYMYDQASAKPLFPRNLLSIPLSEMEMADEKYKEIISTNIGSIHEQSIVETNHLPSTSVLVYIFQNPFSVWRCEYSSIEFCKCHCTLFILMLTWSISYTV